MDSSDRVRYVDISKLIAILAIVFDHSQYYFPAIQYSASFNVIRVWLFSFFLQIFFVTAGIVDREDYLHNPLTWRACIKKWFTAILIPYFLWACILGTNLNVNFLKGILWGTQTSLSAIGVDSILWFFPVLFWTRLIYRLVMRTVFWIRGKKSVWLRLTACAMLTVLGSFLSDNGSNTIIWGLDIACVSAVLMLLGGLAVPSIEWLRHQKTNVKALILLVMLILSVVLAYVNMPIYVNDQGMVVYRASVWMAHGYFGVNIILFLASSIVSCAVILLLSMFLENCEKLAQLGQYTMGFMMTHGIGFRITSAILDFQNIPRILLAAIATIVTVLICVPMVLFIKHFVPVLMGKTSH